MLWPVGDKNTCKIVVEQPGRKTPTERPSNRRRDMLTLLWTRNCTVGFNKRRGTLLPTYGFQRTFSYIQSIYPSKRSGCTTKFRIQQPALHPRSIYIYTALNNSHNKLRSLSTFIRLMFVTETQRVFCETGNILNYYSDKFQVSNGNIRISQADKHYRSYKFKHSPRNTAGWLWFVQTSSVGLCALRPTCGSPC
jgi:hypothetical protein